MTRQNISIGTSANDGTGDTLRSAGTKINQNFVEIYQRIGGDSDNFSAQISFEDSAIVFEGASTDAHETRLVASDVTADVKITLPDSDGVVTINAGRQTLTNKTLQNPTINSPVIGRRLNDSDQNEIILFTKNGSGSAINHFHMQNAISANPIKITAATSNTNLKMEIAPKGNGVVETTRASFKEVEKSSAGNITNTDPSYIICNSGSALALTLDDGTHTGEIKYFTNKGAGVATVTVTSFANGSSFAIAQNEGAQCIWDGSNWFLVGNQSVTTVA